MEEQLFGIYMDPDECARYLGRPVSTIYKWSAQGKIPCRKQGTRNSYFRPEIDAWCQAHTKTPKSEEVSLSKFEQVRQRLRSLKTEDTAIHPLDPSQRGEN